MPLAQPGVHSMMRKVTLERLYRRYNRREFVHPDPLEFLYRYPAVADREIAGLVASSLALGRVKQILSSVERALAVMGPSPRRYLERTPEGRIERAFETFRHRFAGGHDMACLLKGARRVVARFGSLNACFIAGICPDDETVLPALREFAARMDCPGNCLLPEPGKASACKRLNLFLRWMVRSDDVDPGGWTGVSAARLIVPLDTHMARIGAAWGLTRRKSAGMAMALEITRAFRKVAPRDPVRYDFALTRFGIRDDMEMETLLRRRGDAKRGR